VSSDTRVALFDSPPAVRAHPKLVN
jgi:hypothetical protein